MDHLKLNTTGFYHKTEQRIIILSPETLLTVGAFVIETEKLIANPFNKPFKQILPVWYKNIKRTKANMELWLNIQEQWLQIEPQFKAPDVPNRLPVEFKMYQKMNRIWRRLIRFARDTPLVNQIISVFTILNTK
jgi:dynein heavy chain